MAKPSLFQHPKFLLLVHILRMPTAHVLGHLEMLWHSGFSRGDAYLGDEIHVELASGWVGEPGQLCQALLKCGFLDEVEPGKYAIHDLMEHAPDYVKSRIRMRRHRAQERADNTSTHQQPTDVLRNGCATVCDSPELLRTPYQTIPDQIQTDAGASVSAEPDKPASAAKDAAILIFPTVGKQKEWGLRTSRVKQYEQTYPDLDVMAEMRKALQWVLDNSRKTARGMPRYLTGWLNRAQNSGRGRGRRETEEGPVVSSEDRTSRWKRQRDQEQAERESAAAPDEVSALLNGHCRKGGHHAD